MSFEAHLVLCEWTFLDYRKQLFSKDWLGSSCLCQALHAVCQIRWRVIGSWMIKLYKQQINLEKINLGLKFSEFTIAILVRFLLCNWYLLLTFLATMLCFTQFGGRFPTVWILINFVTQLLRGTQRRYPPKCIENTF